MDVTTYFKKQSEGVRLLIIHSTKEELAQQTVNSLRANLKKANLKKANLKKANLKKAKPKTGIVVVDHRVETLGAIAALPRPKKKPNIVLVIAHGDKAKNMTWLFGDKGKDGKSIGTNIGLLKTALNGLLDDTLCLFGVCHLGQALLKEAFINQGGALACVAPKSECTIRDSDIYNDFAKLLNLIQERKDSSIGVDDIHQLLQDTFSPDLLNRVAIYTAAS